MKEEHNNVILTGKIISEPVYDHETFGTSFYNMKLETKRKSDAVDIIPLVVSGSLFDTNDRYTGKIVTVYGEFRSYNKFEKNVNHLVLSVFVREIEEAMQVELGKNAIWLDGYVCKEPLYRETPLGREISDVFLAVNRSYSRSDYIPCIVWGKNAKFVSHLEIGTYVKVYGRIQSRRYIKKYEDGTEEQRTAYEVSVSKIDILEGK